MGHTTGYLLKHVESARVKSSFAENFSSRSLPLPRVVCVEEEISFFVALDRRWRFLLASFLSGERIEQVLRDGKLLEESISQEKSFGEVRIEFIKMTLPFILNDGVSWDEPCRTTKSVSGLHDNGKKQNISQ